MLLHCKGLALFDLNCICKVQGNQGIQHDSGHSVKLCCWWTKQDSAGTGFDFHTECPAAILSAHVNSYWGVGKGRPLWTSAACNLDLKWKHSVFNCIVLAEWESSTWELSRDDLVLPFISPHVSAACCLLLDNWLDAWEIRTGLLNWKHNLYRSNRANTGPTVNLELTCLLVIGYCSRL